MTDLFDRRPALPQPRPPHTSRSRALLGAAALLAAGSTHGAGTLQGGYEIHREGDSPYYKHVWQQTVRHQEAGCIRKGVPFRLVGDIRTATDTKIVEHHHPGLRRSTEYTRYSEPVMLSECHIEVRPREITRIRHFNDKTQTVFTHEVDPVHGPRPWSRLTQPHLDRDTIDLLRDAFSLDKLVPPQLQGDELTIATAPGLQDDRIAGRDCRWLHTLPPAESHRCMLREGIGMPIDESLSSEHGGIVDGRRIVVTRSKVVRFDGPIEIPASVFEPGARFSPDDLAIRDDLDDLDDIDDFDDEAFEDDGDALAAHFNVLIQEWCAIEAARPGGRPCRADGPGLSDPTIRASITAWCAEEATRTGVNRCLRRSHARNGN